MERVIIRHLSGSKANQIEEFALADLTTLVLGRDPAAQIRFHPDRDDVVGRRHAQLERDPKDPSRFRLTDLGSRNGTFVNKVRVNGTVDITVGDVIQLGAGGPELQFDLEPRPSDAVKATRVGTAADVAATRLSAAASASPAPAGSEVSPAEASRAGVGPATVERMIETQAQKSWRGLASAVAVLLAVVAMIGAFVIYSRRQESAERGAQIARLEATRVADAPPKVASDAERPLTPRDITDRYAEATVFIELSWKLIDTESGKQVYRLYRKGKPAYWQLPDRIYPMLTLSDGNGTNRVIGERGTGSGFVVRDNGFILTNRHVAANWLTSFPLDPERGSVYSRDDKYLREINKGDRQSLLEYVPGRPPAALPSLQGKLLEGRHDYLDVTFPRTKLRVNARVVLTSDKADVALVKVDLPTPLPKVVLNDSYDTIHNDTIRAGDAITVLGYPAVSPGVRVSTASHDLFNPEAQEIVVPDPTTSAGHIGKVPPREALHKATDNLQLFSPTGDLYQLTITSTGAGNSGGPVFDDRGRVIAIFSASMSDEQGTRVTLAVPIHYGMELMGLQKAVQ